MGAGGSTAISSSSLDISHRQRYRLRNQFQENHLVAYNNNNDSKKHNLRNISNHHHQLNAPGQKLLSNMKQSNSYFNLNSNYLIDNEMISHHLDHAGSNQKGWFDTNHSEAYSLSNANIGASRPIMVLPNKPISPSLSNNNTKRSIVQATNGVGSGNAGVANRIQRCQKQQQQQERLRSEELRKFSDSLPSLNNLSPSYQSSGAYNLKDVPNNKFDVIDDELQYIVGSQHQKRISLNQNCAKQQKLYRISGDKTKLNLVINKNNDDSFRSKARQNHHRYLQSGRNEILAIDNSIGDGKRIMKRAISLSSLHNQNYNHRHHHSQYAHHSQSPDQQTKNTHHQYQYQNNLQSRNCKQQLVSKIMNGKQKNYSNSGSAIASPESITCGRFSSTCDLYQYQQQQQHQNSAYLKQQHQQPSFLPKKLSKYKQAPNIGGQVPKRYSKHYDQQQLHQQQQQQQGCPVLPPLPRSQSLHEMIQLRATENGQRMRTTGTLRGPFGASGGGEDRSNKVNLVAELLESRRQQKLNEGQENSTKDSEIMLSPSSSSSDDGIHDVSTTEDHSTGDSRRIRDNIDNHRRTKSSSSQEDFGSQNRGRIFKRNSNQQQAQFNNKRLSQQNFSSDHKQQHEISVTSQTSAAFPSSSASRKDHQQVNKSTLKRSLSHSALQTSLSNLRDDNLVDDEDESDDLNELAKFLHQFKQRQINNKTSPLEREDEEGRKNSKMIISHKQVSSSSKSSSNSTINVSANNLQQSPNSTTSSSGFASSTCTTNSMSSSSGSSRDQMNRRQQQQLEFSNNTSKNSAADKEEVINSKKFSGRKKYPAPPRPTDLLSSTKRAQTNLALNSKQQQNYDQGKIGKCLISSKLKLSSSLLSIVDEYNSTLQKGDQLSKNLINDGVTRGELFPKRGENSIKSDQSSPIELDDDDYHCQKQNLEQLKRYTQLRQMSQSELALNHLTSTSLVVSNNVLTKKQQSRQVKSKRNDSDREDNNNNSGGRPYKSKLFNLIRRISDRSEVGSSCSSNGQSVNSTSITRDSPVGGHFEYKNSLKQQQGAINQSTSELYVSDSNKSEQQVEKVHKCSGKQKQRQQQQGRQDLFLENKIHGIKDGACLSESLCDLNFDCDFELIKNCGSSANEYRGTPKQQQQQQQTSANSSLLLLSKSVDLKPFPHNKPAKLSDVSQQHDQHKDGTKKHQAAIHPSKSRGENNWRLAPTTTSLSLTDSIEQREQDKSRQQQQKRAYQSGVGKDNGRSMLNKLHALSTNTKTVLPEATISAAPSTGVSEAAASTHTSASTAAAISKGDKLPSHAKLKWSASGWLMNSNSSSSSSKGGSQSSGSGSKSKNEQKHQVEKKSSKISKQQQQHVAGNEGTSSGKSKSCLTKFILSSRTSKATTSTKCTADQGNMHQATSIKLLKEKDQPVVGGGAIESTSSNYSSVNNEANQLLDDLDHSLDLVSGNSCTPKAVQGKSWWKMDHTDEMLPPISRQLKNYQQARYVVDDEGDINEKKKRRVAHENGFSEQNNHNNNDGNDSDCDSSIDNEDVDQDDDEEDYASLSRAMIKATFDVEMNGLNVTPGFKSIAQTSVNLNLRRLPAESGSPSNSFTFSAPSSPIGASINDLDGISPETEMQKELKVANNKTYQLKRSNVVEKNLNHCRQTTDDDADTTAEAHDEHLMVNREVKQNGEAYTRKYIQTGGNHVISSSSSTATNSDLISQATACVCSGGICSNSKLCKGSSVAVSGACCKGKGCSCVNGSTGSSGSNGNSSGSSDSVGCSLNGYKGEEATATTSSSPFTSRSPVITKTVGSSKPCNLDSKHQIGYLKDEVGKQGEENEKESRTNDEDKEKGKIKERTTPQVGGGKTENSMVKRIMLTKRFGLEPNSVSKDTNEHPTPNCCPHSACSVLKNSDPILSRANNDNLDTCYTSSSSSSATDNCCFMKLSNHKGEEGVKLDGMKNSQNKTSLQAANGLDSNDHFIQACWHQVNGQTNGLLPSKCQSNGCVELNCSNIQVVRSGQKSHFASNISPVERKLQQQSQKLAANVGCCKLEVAPNSRCQQQHHAIHSFSATPNCNSDPDSTRGGQQEAKSEEMLTSLQKECACVKLGVGVGIQGHLDVKCPESTTYYSQTCDNGQKIDFMNNIDASNGAVNKHIKLNSSICQVATQQMSDNLLDSQSARDSHDIRSTTYCKRSAAIVTKSSPNSEIDNNEFIIQKKSCHCLLDNCRKEQQFLKGEVMDDNGEKIILSSGTKLNGLVETKSFFLSNHQLVSGRDSYKINSKTTTTNDSRAPNNFDSNENKNSCAHGMEKVDEMSSRKILQKNKGNVKISSETTCCLDSEIHHHHHQQQRHLISNMQQQRQQASQKQDNICYSSGSKCLSNCCSKSHNETFALTNAKEMPVTKCKVALCHHPSSSVSQENYTDDKDVKSEVSDFVNSGNLISKTGQHLLASSNALNVDDDENKCCLSSVVSESKCHCCQAKQQQQQLQLPICKSEEGTNKKCLVRSSNLNRFKLIHKQKASAKLSSEGQHSTTPDASKEAHLLATNIRNHKSTTNLIYRSNSELVSPGLSLTNTDSVGSKGKKQVGGKEKLLFGKLRSSLLNRKETENVTAAAEALSKLSKQLANSQLSLMSHGHYVSPFIDPRSSDSTFSQSNVEFDDNFILKRKTPNAGLKSRC